MGYEYMNSNCVRCMQRRVDEITSEINGMFEGGLEGGIELDIPAATYGDIYREGYRGRVGADFLRNSDGDVLCFQVPEVPIEVAAQYGFAIPSMHVVHHYYNEGGVNSRFFDALFQESDEGLPLLVPFSGKVEGFADYLNVAIGRTATVRRPYSEYTSTELRPPEGGPAIRDGKFLRGVYEFDFAAKEWVKRAEVYVPLGLTKSSCDDTYVTEWHEGMGVPKEVSRDPKCGSDALWSFLPLNTGLYVAMSGMVRDDKRVLSLHTGHFDENRDALSFPLAAVRPMQMAYASI